MFISLIVLIIVLLALDLLWINYFMKPRYEVIIQKLTNKPIEFKYLPAVFAYIIMVAGIYYFAIKDKKTSQDALINGCLLGFVMYGVYDATLYAIFPIDDIETGIIDVIWGTFVCGVSAYAAHKINKINKMNKV
jgi:uncharacterized membrane protein